MPALPPATNICRVVYGGTYGSARWANVFHVRYAPGPPTQSDMTALATGLRNAWNGNLAALCVTNVSLTSTTVTDLSSATGLVGTNTTSAAGSVVATSQLPANVAMVLSMKIGRRYRGGHPRMYITGQSQSNTVNANAFTGAWLTTSTTNAAGWLTAVNALTFTSMTTIQAVNLSYYSGHALRPVPVFDTITAIVIHARTDSMRRRLGKEF